jgi:hypothetical protein
MGVGERSEALLNIKAMGEKMLCPPREPGLCPPPSFSPLLNSTSIKAWPLASQLGCSSIWRSAGDEDCWSLGPRPRLAAHPKYTSLRPG